MNRNDEYINLIEELDNKSEKIDNLYKKANKRLIKKRVLTSVTTTLSTIATLLIIFTILVNNVHSFAYACGSVPILKDLAKFVAKSPSLSAAVEYQYVQPIEITKTQDDITATIEYVIVDQKQVNIFYSLKSEKYKALEAFPDALDRNMEFLECTLSYGSNDDNNELKMITLDFFDKNVPDYILLKLKVRDNGEYIQEAMISDEIGSENADNNTRNEENSEILTEFEIDLNLDPNYTAQGQTINLNKKFEVDGQTLILTTVDIYPTHIRINFEDDENNTKWLKSLNFRIEDEKGNKFEKISNGVTSTGSVDSPMNSSHRLESSFFSRSEEFTLFIDNITWLDKDREKLKIDLKNSKYDTLPDNVELYKIKKINNGYVIDFLNSIDEPNHITWVFGFNYYDEAGNKYDIDNHSASHANSMDLGKKYNSGENQLIESLTLYDCNSDIVYLEPSYTSIYKLDEPIKIKIK